MTVRPSTPHVNRPKRPKLALAVAMSDFSKRPARTVLGHIENGINSALCAGFGHFGHFGGGVQGGEHAF